MRKRARISLLTLIALLLAGCPRPIRTPEEPPAPADTAADTRGAAVYGVNSRNSEIHILVYRGGALSRLGHNHVITSKSVSGRAWIHPTFAKSGFELSFPVSELVVDDLETRRAAGAEFTAEISAASLEGTRKNMLRPEVLDAERFPTIELRAANVAGSLESPRITARITIRGATRDVEVPTKLSVQGARLSAMGEFDIQQTDFGIKPFSAALGALEVQDRLHIRFNIVANKK
ncbi:MAG: YceI family protein [Steroidobacter sp.]